MLARCAHPRYPLRTASSTARVRSRAPIFDRIDEPFSVKDTVADLADVPVKLTGRLVERGGVRGIQIVSIEQIRK